MTDNILKTANAKSEGLSASSNGWLGRIVSCLIPFIPLVVYYFVPFTTVSLDTAFVLLIAAYVVLASITNNEKVRSENCRFYFSQLSFFPAKRGKMLDYLRKTHYIYGYIL